MLRDLYIDVDAVEFYVGIFVEKTAYSKVFGEALITAIGNYAFRMYVGMFKDAQTLASKLKWVYKLWQIVLIYISYRCQYQGRTGCNRR